MFSKLKSGEKIPFSEIAHIDALTMAYVLSLRENPEEDEYMKNLSEEDRKLLESETKPMRKGVAFLHLFVPSFIHSCMHSYTHGCTHSSPRGFYPGY